MIGPVTYLDVMIFGVPILLGLIVMWRGVGRSLLSMPVRLLVSLFLGWVVASAVAFIVEVGQASWLDWAGLLSLSRFGGLAAIRGLAFFIVFVVLMLVLRRIRAHLVRDDAGVRVGVAHRAAGFVVGAVIGLVLMLIVVVPTYMFYEAFTPEPEQQSAAVRRSISLPLIKQLSESVRSLLQPFVPSNLGPR